MQGELLVLPGPLVLPWVKVTLLKRIVLLLTMTKPGKLLNWEFSTAILPGRPSNPRIRPSSACKQNMTGFFNHLTAGLEVLHSNIARQALNPKNRPLSVCKCSLKPVCF